MASRSRSSAGRRSAWSANPVAARPRRPSWCWGSRSRPAASIRFEGQDLAALDAAGRRHYRKSVQAVFQDPYASLNPRMRVGAIIAEPLTTNETLTAGEARKHVLRLLDLVGLPARSADLFPQERAPPADRRARQRQPEPVGWKLRSRSPPARARTSALQPTPPLYDVLMFVPCCLSHPNGKRCNLFRAKWFIAGAAHDPRGVTIQGCDVPHSEAPPGVRPSRCGRRDRRSAIGGQQRLE